MSVLFWIFHENLFNRFSAMLLRGMDCSEKVGEKSCVQGVKWNFLKMFPIVPCIKSHLPWKFHENPFSHFAIMLLTDRRTDRLTDRPTDRQTSNGQRWKHNLCHGGGNEFYTVINKISWQKRKANIDKLHWGPLLRLYVSLVLAPVYRICMYDCCVMQMLWFLAATKQLYEWYFLSVCKSFLRWTRQNRRRLEEWLMKILSRIVISLLGNYTSS